MPTLYQQYSGYSAILGRASRYGAGYPENANIVFAAGPDDRIGPERSENLTMSAHLTPARGRSEEQTSELQSLMRISYAVFCLKKNKTKSNDSKVNTTDKNT